jgi:hypothetical protein
VPVDTDIRRDGGGLTHPLPLVAPTSDERFVARRAR